MKPWILRLEVAGLQLVGTCHEPDGGRQGRVGILFLNAGPTPRSGSSDLSVQLANHLATLGYLSFRFDPPGLGDSRGTLPDTRMQFWQQVQRGLNTREIVDLARKLRATFGLTGLIAGGMCAGAVTAIRAASRIPQEFTGLILLEPDLRPVRLPPASPAEASSGPPRERPRKTLRWVRQGLQFMFGEGRVHGWARGWRSFGHRLVTLLRGRSLPRHLSLPLLLRWHRILSWRMPTLLVTQRGGQEQNCQIILAGVPSVQRRSVTHLSVTDSNHIFTWGNARELILEAAGVWAARVSPKLTFAGPPPPVVARSESPVAAES